MLRYSGTSIHLDLKHNASPPNLNHMTAMGFRLLNINTWSIELRGIGMLPASKVVGRKFALRRCFSNLDLEAHPARKNKKSWDFKDNHSFTWAQNFIGTSDPFGEGTYDQELKIGSIMNPGNFSYNTKVISLILYDHLVGKWIRTQEEL